MESLEAYLFTWAETELFLLGLLLLLVLAVGRLLLLDHRARRAAALSRRLHDFCS
jgi:hypothetical protein